MSSLILRNPHSVLAALETRPSDVLQISAPRGRIDEDGSDDPWRKVIQVARQKKIPVRDQKPGPKLAKDVEGGRMGAGEAQVKERASVPIEKLFQGAKERASGKGLWLALDSLLDPHNVGAIFRTASFFGVQGIVLTQERSAPLSAAAYDVASGGLEHVPFSLQINLQRAFEAAKDAGLWVLGTSEHAKEKLGQVQRDRPWLLVLGNEEKGLRRLTQEACDVLCGIPPLGKVTSLNVSVAAGICIAHLS